MKKVIVGSQNPVKIEVARQAFEQVFPEDTFEFTGYKAISHVSDQPKSDEETLEGAYNRVSDCKEKFPDADFWVAQESGVIDTIEHMFETSYIVIESREGNVGQAKAASFEIPKPIADDIRHHGMELGPAADKLFGVSNSKQQGSIIGLLTNNLVDRTSAYLQSAIFALMRHRHPELYR
jgi:inosine/xanthosine triphosphatase